MEPSATILEHSATFKQSATFLEQSASFEQCNFFGLEQSVDLEKENVDFGEG